MILLSACLGAKTCSKVMVKDEELLAPLSVHDIGHFFKYIHKSNEHQTENNKSTDGLGYNIWL